MVKKPTVAETIRLNRLCWFGHEQRMEENRIPKKVWSMNLETIRLRGRPRNRWQDEVRKDGRLAGGGKEYTTERNGRSSWEQQGIVTFCTCQWINEHNIQYSHINNILKISNPFCSSITSKFHFTTFTCIWNDTYLNITYQITAQYETGYRE